MTIPERATLRIPQSTAALSWRDILLLPVSETPADHVALECLIDHLRSYDPRSGETS